MHELVRSVLGREGLALLQENHDQNISPLPPSLPYIINIPINRPVTLNNLLYTTKFLSFG